VLGVLEFHAGAEWDLFEVRYVRVDDGVFVVDGFSIGFLHGKQMSGGVGAARLV
jgi:hypothetical protein